MRDFFKNNGIWLLVIALLLALITAVTSLTFGGVAMPVADLLGVVSTPFRNGLNGFVRWTESVSTEAFRRKSMEEELAALRAENAQLREQAREGEAASRENQRLRTLVDLAPKSRDFTLESAAVTARNGSNWTSTLTLSKGSTAGVEAGDCAVDQYWNLVGVVTQVGLNWSTLRTVVDADTEMGALIARTDRAAVAEGDFTLMGQGRLKLTFFPEDTLLLAGDEVLTSGFLSRGKANYPSRLLIGTVEQVRPDEGGMSDYAVLLPAARLDSLEQVFVIKDFSVVE